MAVTAAQFRQDFPEFAETARYPDAQVAFWLSLADSQLSEQRWGSLHERGVELYAAHHLVVSARQTETAAKGGAPGAVSGPATAKAVDKVSASYDTGAVTLDQGAFWNMSVYGIQFLWWARMMGAGGIQL
jgi:hypothetical protein